MRKCIYAYAWDFLDEGIDNVLTRIKSLGIDAVAMAVSYHAGKFILPHNPNARVYFPEDGTVYFIPKAEYYPGLIKPKVASILDSGDILLSVSQKCIEYGIELHAWTVCLHNTRLGSKHPEISARNVFGDRYPYSLCPAQPEVAKYAMGLISDLADNYNLNTIFLESLGYMGFSHGYHHEFFGVKLQEIDEILLSLCFCDCCVEEAKKAGIDAEKVMQICRDHVDESINDSPNGSADSLTDFANTHPELTDYLKMRTRIVTRLYKQVQTYASKNNVKIDCFNPVREAFNEGYDLRDIRALVDHYVIPVGTPDLSRIETDIDIIKGLFRTEQIVLSINMGVDATPTRQNFNQKIELINKHNLAGCNFYNYSNLPFSRLEWIKD